MKEEELTDLVRALLKELDNPKRHLPTIANDFRECGIDYAIIGSFAVNIHNHVRYGNDIDVLISKRTFHKIEEFLVGHGYSYRPGSDRHLYYEYLGGKIPLDIYVEDEERYGYILPNPLSCRIQVCRICYGTLPLIMNMKLRADDLGDVLGMIEANGLGKNFVQELQPDVREKFLEILKSSEKNSQ